ncbi:cob(I)alamin adenosyltransferase [Desulfitispora alkaliphila]|uniref:cob(I)yrinic acid a,c-diamide adenosyltransferase n=1 Tax=Desulfitispora alkaliphila TaxID=622674 RepID=UPI003D2138A0
MNKKGIVQVYTGDGKGKTTSSLGQTMRVLGHGWKVVMIQFMKGSPKYGEVKFAEKTPNFTLIQSGLETFVSKENPSKEDLRLAKEGWNKAKEILKNGSCDLLVLDEINIALDYNLVPLNEVVHFIKNKPTHLDLIMTGRYVPKEIVELADLVSEVREVKHHYSSGVEAREGVEF